VIAVELGVALRTEGGASADTAVALTGEASPVLDVIAVVALQAADPVFTGHAVSITGHALRIQQVQSLDAYLAVGGIGALGAKTSAGLCHHYQQSQNNQWHHYYSFHKSNTSWGINKMYSYHILIETSLFSSSM
jgi:hypothetical protein